MKKLSREQKLMLGVAAVVILAGLAPIIPVPFTQTKSSVGCSFPTQIAELERYGRVEVEYRSPFWSNDTSEWTAAFNMSSNGEYLSISTRKDTICEAVDDLYYKVMEHPLKAK